LDLLVNKDILNSLAWSYWLVDFGLSNQTIVIMNKKDLFKFFIERLLYLDSIYMLH
jgi:hypothetical protein